MAHEYSVQIHDWITQKIQDLNKQLKSAQEMHNEQAQYKFKGQLNELDRIRSYLTDRIDLSTHKYYQ